MAAFQTKNFLSIVASMVNRMRATTTKITDFTVGSVARTLVEAVAQEIDQLYQQILAGLLAAIPVSVYRSFGFAVLTETYAGGLVRVTITAQTATVTIPANVIFTPPTGSVTYSSTTAVTIAVGGTYADVPVVASVAGSAGNIAAGTSFSVSNQPPGFVNAINLSAFAGQDAETDDQRKARFQQYISTISRGTPAAIKYALTNLTYLTDAYGNITEKVKFAAVIEPYETDNTQPVGLVNCYVHNGTGSTSTGLVSRGLQVVYGYYDASGNAVPGYKAAGTHVTVSAATETTVAVTATLTAASGFDHATLVTAAEEAITSYLLGLDIGAPALVAKVIETVMLIDGVGNFVMTAPAADVTPATSAKLMPGTLTIS